MGVTELLENIFAGYYKHFPKGWIKAHKSSIGRDDYIVFGVQQKDKHSNGITENDPAYHIIFLRVVENGAIEAECTNYARLYIKSEDPRYALGVVKTGYRAKTGDAAAIAQHLDNYFKKLRSILEENLDKLTVDLDTLGF